ncbi:MAG: LPS export ABC transporter periplasmic protein LptC [Candidatus Kapabacteria bacterium]|nr:LPS export ABC transporter periplasmic protein LptC [Candidatus Kapabacteria bacterium]MBX7155999.1 LPS export ABC transporter periplasmic protein LptC [Bacteroidota bacterium]
MKRIPFIVLLVCSLLVFTSCEDDTEKQSTVNASKLDLAPSNTLWDFSMMLTDSSFVKAKISARKARLYTDRQESFLDTNVVVDFLTVSGNRSARLTADSAHIDNRTNNMWAKGRVIVIADSSHTRVETSVMMWDNTRRKLYSNEYVKINRPGELIEGGVGFESDEYLKNYRIFKVSGVKQ